MANTIAIVRGFSGLPSVLVLVSIVSMSSLLPTSAIAESRWASGQEGGGRWVPSVSITSGVNFEDASARGSGRISRGCTAGFGLDADSGCELLRPEASGDDRDVTPFLGLSLELMAPELPLPGAPRLFVGGELLGMFATDRNLATEGNPGEIGPPFFEPSIPTTQFSENLALGQGTRVSAVMDDLTYGLHLGVGLPVEIAGRPARVKPSIAWTRFRVETEGELVRAQCRQSPINPSSTICNEDIDTSIPGLFVGFTREIRLLGSDAATFDAIGPGLDIEVDTGRHGPLGSALYVGFRAYHVLGDRNIVFESPVQSFDDELGTDDTGARFEVEVDSWMYRFHIGFRIQWLGFGT